VGTSERCERHAGVRDGMPLAASGRRSACRASIAPGVPESTTARPVQRAGEPHRPTTSTSDRRQAQCAAPSLPRDPLRVRRSNPRRAILDAASGPRRTIHAAPSTLRRAILDTASGPRRTILDAASGPRRTILDAASGPRRAILDAASGPRRALVRARRPVTDAADMRHRSTQTAHPDQRLDIARSLRPPKPTQTDQIVHRAPRLDGKIRIMDTHDRHSYPAGS
jgi:hypothetical protein